MPEPPTTRLAALFTPSPSAVVKPNFNVPALTVSAPVLVFAPERISEPAPALVIPAAPARVALMVATLALASVLTVMVGVPPASVRTLALTPLLSSNQPAAEVVFVSPKMR